MDLELQEIIEPMLNRKYTAKMLKPEHKLKEILEDSLSHIELAVEIQYRMGIFITDSELQKIKTVEDLCNYIEEYKCVLQNKQQ